MTAVLFFIFILGMLYHKRTEHFEEKPFACEECGAKFAANSSLKNHMRLHTGEKPYHCKHCDMSFSVAAALAYHTKKKHSEGSASNPHTFTRPHPTHTFTRMPNDVMHTHNTHNQLPQKRFVRPDVCVCLCVCREDVFMSVL